MKSFLFSTGGSFATTLALMLLLIVAACENDDEQPTKSDPILDFQLGEDINVVVGERVSLSPSTRYGYLFNPPSEASWSWEILSAPDNSKAALIDADKVTTFFSADLPGEYQILLSIILYEQITTDTLMAYAHSVVKLNGNHRPLFETDGSINKLIAYQDKLYAGGFFTRIDGVEAYSIAAYDGTVWAPLGAGLIEHGYVTDMIVYEGELYITGVFGTPGGVTSPAIVRWNGEKWIEVPGLELLVIDGDWGPYFVNSGQFLEIFNDELYITGVFQVRDMARSVNYSLMKWDGNQLTGMNTPTSISELEVYDNKLYSVNEEYNLVAYDGSSWHTMSALPKGSEFTSVKLVSYAERLLVSVATDVKGLRIFTWDGVQFLDSGKPVSRKPFVYPSVSETIDNALYLGGDWSQEVVGTKSNGLITWNGEKWGVVDDGLDIAINAIEQFQDQIFMAGFISGPDTYWIEIWQP